MKKKIMTTICGMAVSLGACAEGTPSDIKNLELDFSTMTGVNFVECTTPGWGDTRQDPDEPFVYNCSDKFDKKDKAKKDMAIAIDVLIEDGWALDDTVASIEFYTKPSSKTNCPYRLSIGLHQSIYNGEEHIKKTYRAIGSDTPLYSDIDRYILIRHALYPVCE